MTDLWLRCIAWMRWCFFPLPSFNLLQGRWDLAAERPVMCAAQSLFCLLGMGEERGRAPQTTQSSFSPSQQSFMNTEMR